MNLSRAICLAWICDSASVFAVMVRSSPRKHQFFHDSGISWHTYLALFPFLKVLACNMSLKRVLTTGQEEHNKPESSAAKLYCLHLQEPGAQAPSPKNERPPAYIFRSQSASAPERQSKSSIVYIFRSKQARARAREQKRKSASKRENGGNPVPLLRRIILCLGCITPWLAAAHGRVDVTGKAEYM